MTAQFLRLGPYTCEPDDRYSCSDVYVNVDQICALRVRKNDPDHVSIDMVNGECHRVLGSPYDVMLAIEEPGTYSIMHEGENKP